MLVTASCPFPLLERWKALCARNPALDFVDCVLAAEHDAAGREVLTFDRKLNALICRMDDASS